MCNHFHTKDYNYNARLAEEDATLSHSSCNWATGRVCYIVGAWVFHLHCGCLMKNVKTWVNGICKT